MTQLMFGKNFADTGEELCTCFMGSLMVTPCPISSLWKRWQNLTVTTKIIDSSWFNIFSIVGTAPELSYYRKCMFRQYTYFSITVLYWEIVYGNDYKSTRLQYSKILNAILNYGNTKYWILCTRRVRLQLFYDFS
jgi:hypothetical protein